MDARARKAVSPTMVKVITSVTDVGQSGQEKPTVTEAMSALLAISKSAQSEEESALNAAIPVVLETIKKHSDMREAVSAVSVLR